MTDQTPALDAVLRGVEIARLSAKRRKAQAFTASEEPEVIRALLQAEKIIVGLLECSITKGRTHETPTD